MVAWIGETYTSRVGWEHLEGLVEIGNRLAGSPGERAGAEATREAFEGVGARDARLAAFEIEAWTRGDAAVRAGGSAEAAIGLPGSPAGTVTGELADLGDGLPGAFDRDLEGRVVMVSTSVPAWYGRFIHRREKYYRAVSAGAVGFVFRNHVPGCLAPTGGIGASSSPVGPVPGVGVSREVGARFARRYDGTEVTVEVDADVGPAESANVHAAVGPETEEVVLVTSHVDAHDIAEGAGDNAMGTAVVVEVARALAGRADELETRVEFVAYGAEEVGLLGSRYDAESRDLDRVKAVVNSDGVGRGRTLQFYTQGFDDLETVAMGVAGEWGHEVEVVPRLSPHSDHWPFVQRGVPGYHVSSATDGRDRGWGHTRADTLDKLDVRDLRAHAVFLTELVVRLADADTTIVRRDPESIADQLEAEDRAEGMRITGDWPYA